MKFQITRPQWLVELNIVIMLNIKNYKLLLSQIAVAGVILKTGVCSYPKFRITRVIQTKILSQLDFLLY